MKLVYPACFYPHKDDGGFTAVVPDLPGCTTEGDDLADAIQMATDAASGWILDELEDGNEIPPFTPIEKIKSGVSDGIVSYIALDMDSYIERYGDKAVRKNLTIPSWLATAADKVNANYSKILQNALINELNLTQREARQ